MSDRDQTLLDRRALLRGAGLAAGLGFLPALGRRVVADAGPTPRARRLLILNLVGGIRSSAAFHASTSTPYNPYGMLAPTGGTPPFGLGRLLDDTPPGQPPLPDASYTFDGDWQGARLPRLREIATQFSVLGTYSVERGDHQRARAEEPTGGRSGRDPGILTRIAAGLDGSGATPPFPAFHITPQALFGNAGTLTKYVPLSLASYTSLASAANTDPTAIALTGNKFATWEPMRDAFDKPRVDSRHGVGKLVASTFSQHRAGARAFGQRLSQPDLAVGRPDDRDAALGTVALPNGQTVPLRNGMLYDLVTRGAPSSLDQSINVALAIRLLQIGSPAVTVELSSFDLHSGERTMGPPLYGYLGRLWATLRWLLPRIPDPSGEGSLFDRTLVITTSDFGRDKGRATGWNAGDGTDHGADHACFYLAHAVMGAGVTQNRHVGPVDASHYNATLAPIRYSSRELLVTLLHALGLDPYSDAWGLPAGGNPIEELWA